MRTWIIVLIICVLVIAGGGLYWNYAKQKQLPSLESDGYCIQETTGLKYVCDQILFNTDDNRLAKKIADENDSVIFIQIPEMMMHGIEFEESKSSDELEGIIREIHNKYSIPASLNFVSGPAS